MLGSGSNVFGIFGRPKKEIPGHELAGKIEAVGINVKLFKEGDQVFGTTTGLSVGANAEYVVYLKNWRVVITVLH
jgi:NADPH:quinone reductase-like Zn-dependent oxidoreductase